MCEPPDDTTERRERDATPPARREHDTPDEREHAPGSYYYDDATGYEIYDPAEDDEDEESDAGESDGMQA